MNYARIYEEFIQDRKTKFLPEGTYTEKHHIKPRCLGGGDESENIIRLTPEDHYFAHLLMAKAYGGKLWAAVYAMCNLINGGTKKRLKLQCRIKFGHVRRSLANYYRAILSGPDGKIADKSTYELRHFDGRIAEGNRFELSELTGVTRQQISAVLRGAKKNAKGWYCLKHNPLGLTTGELLSAAISHKEVINLYHFDGRLWSGTMSEFHKQFGSALSFHHAEGCVLGWYRSKDYALNHDSFRRLKTTKATNSRGDISGQNNPRADKKIYAFRVIDTGEVYNCTRVELFQRFGIRSAALCSLFSGRQKKTGGIELA